MRSPRHIDFRHEALATMTFSTDRPPADSLSARLWKECEDIAEKALESDFVQGIGMGTLGPDLYGQYTVQDCAYCAYAENDYRDLEQRAVAAGEPVLAAFARARHEGFVKYNQASLPRWHISDVKALALNRAARQYIDHEHHAATRLLPIYGVLAQLPCSQLWPWLANKLKAGSPPNNLYQSWISGNASFHGAYRLDNFMNEWFDAHPDQLDHTTALLVIRGSLIGELNLFRSACGQDLEPMPELAG